MTNVALSAIELCAGVGMLGEGVRAMKRGLWNPDRLLAMYRMGQNQHTKRAACG